MTFHSSFLISIHGSANKRNCEFEAKPKDKKEKLSESKGQPTKRNCEIEAKPKDNKENLENRRVEEIKENEIKSPPIEFSQAQFWRDPILGFFFGIFFFIFFIFL